MCMGSHGEEMQDRVGGRSGQASLEHLAPHLLTMHECVRSGARTTQRPQSVAQLWGAYKGDKAITLQPTQGLNYQLCGPSLWHLTDQNLALPLASCVRSGKLLNLSEFDFAH